MSTLELPVRRGFLGGPLITEDWPAVDAVKLHQQLVTNEYSIIDDSGIRTNLCYPKCLDPRQYGAVARFDFLRKHWFEIHIVLVVACCGKLNCGEGIGLAEL